MKLTRARAALAALCVLAGGGVLAGCGGSDSDGSSGGSKELVVTSFGGDYEKAQQKALFEKFEQKYDVKVKLVTLYSADALAKLTAARGNAGFDVVQFSGGQEAQAAADGLLEKVSSDELPNAGAVYPQAVQDGYAPAYAFDVTGLIHRDTLEPAPDSWTSLSDSAYKGRVAIPDISNTFGVQTLVGLANVGGGGETDVQPGFEALKGTVGNIHSVFKDAPTMVQLMSRDEVDLAVYDGIYTYLMQKQGIPVEFSVPKEGSFLTKVTMNAVAGTKNRDLALKLIDMALDPEVQAEFADGSGSVPTNRDAKVTGPAAKVVATPEEISRLQALDDAYVAKNRAAWTSEWNRIIAK